MTRFLGIDLGGTAIKHGVIDPGGSVIDSGQMPTPEGGREAILAALAGLVRSYGAEHALGGVGVGTAGAVDFGSGRVLGHSPNIPDWGDTPVRDLLEPQVGLRVAVDNDANCMALAEMSAGAGRGVRTAFFITLGTGIGSALVLDGRLWRGAHSLGGEWGHATVVHNGRLCACGQRGHIEAYASAPALVRRMLELARQGLPSVYGQAGDAAAALGSKEVFDAAASGDAAAAQAVAETAAYLASAIASVVNLIDPERVVLGGGMAAAGAGFLGTIRHEVSQRVHAGVRDFVRIEPAHLGNQAGFIGAALLAREAAPRTGP